MSHAQNVKRHAEKVRREAQAAIAPPGAEVVATVDALSTHTILDAMGAPALFGSQFGGVSWEAWRTFLAVLFGLPLPEGGLELFQQRTGRQDAPSGAFSEAWAIVGRRGGKSRMAGLVAVYLACFRDWRGVLAPGERGTVMVLASDRRQSRVVFRYIVGLLDSVPALARLVDRRRRDSIDLHNGVSIEIHAASYKSVRGYTLLAVIADEVAFWRSEDSANPDREILDALRPGMATAPGSVLLVISTPYARRGEVWRAYERYHGRDDAPVLCWRADTLSMNPTVDPAVIARAYEDDPIAAAAEWGGEFRHDVEAFLSPEALAAVTVLGRYELPPVVGVCYAAFADPSGGSQDSFTLAVAHSDPDGIAVLDLVREWRAPFDPDPVVAEFAAVLKTYGLSVVEGDRYAGQWVIERFREHGVEYQLADRTKSGLYRELLPSVNAGRVALLDDRRLRAQLEGLERRVARGGKDSIDHPPGSKDDVANAAAGALVAVLGAPIVDASEEWFDPDLHGLGQFVL